MLDLLLQLQPCRMTKPPCLLQSFSSEAFGDSVATRRLFQPASLGLKKALGSSNSHAMVSRASSDSRGESKEVGSKRHGRDVGFAASGLDAVHDKSPTTLQHPSRAYRGRMNLVPWTQTEAQQRCGEPRSRCQ